MGTTIAVFILAKTWIIIFNKAFKTDALQRMAIIKNHILYSIQTNLIMTDGFWAETNAG